MQRSEQRFDPEGPLTAVDFVIEQVRNHRDGGLPDGNGLGEIVSGDAINHLFGGQGRRRTLREGSLTFQWDDVWVVVHSDGRVEVEAV